jgi:hypothetical protein
LTGIHTGPRQFELPPNIPVLDSAGRYWTESSWPPVWKTNGLSEVVAREGADAVGAEELLLVEDVGQDALELHLGERGEEAASGMTDEPVHGRGHVGDHGRVPLLEERDHLHQLRVADGHVLLEHRARAQRQEPDHRADLEPERLAVRQAEHVVEEARPSSSHMSSACSPALSMA